MLFLQLPSAKPDSALVKIAQHSQEKLDMIRNGDWNSFLQQTISDLLNFGKNLVIAAIIFLIGRWLIRLVIKFMERMFVRRSVEPSLRTFLKSIVRITLYIFLLSIVISQLGIKASSLLALLGAAGLAIGMALSGTLQNFAGGVMILLIKPYRVGDFIEAQGQIGTVKDIQLFNTIVNTPDNKTIYIPNGPLSTGIINNYSREETRRVEWKIGINYGDDFGKAQSVIRKILDQDPRILRSPDYTIEIDTLADSSVNIITRAWVPSSEYWDVFFDINSRLYKQLPEEGIDFPFPQLDVHINGQM